jgi:hypothetical protein
MIVAHHGGELSPLVAMLLGAGAASPLLVLVRSRLTSASEWLRRRTPRK